MMKNRIGQTVAVVAIAAVTVALFAGSVLADPGTPGGGLSTEPGFGMMGEMDQETWGEMIQHMTQVHGPELTGKMIQWMNEEGGHCDGEGSFPGMMGWGFNDMMRIGFGEKMDWGSNGASTMMGSAVR